MEKHWKIRNNNKMLEARFEFHNFELVRNFLDNVAEIVDSKQNHPNISFGKNHASIAIYAEDEALQKEDFILAEEIDSGFKEVTTI